MNVSTIAKTAGLLGVGVGAGVLAGVPAYRYLHAQPRIAPLDDRTGDMRVAALTVPGTLGLVGVAASISILERSTPLTLGSRAALAGWAGLAGIGLGIVGGAAIGAITAPST